MADKAPSAADVQASVQGAINSALAGLAGLGTASTQNYIGLPSKFELPGQTTTDATGKTTTSPTLAQQFVDQNPAAGAPRYKVGAEWLPVQGGATGDEISLLQRQMVQGGVLNASQFQNGVWDAVSQDAFKYLLGYANAAGTDWQTALNTLQNSTEMVIDPVTGKPVPKKKGVQALKLEYTNPDDVEVLAQNTAQSKLGRPLTTAELERFQNTWKAEQSGYQTSAASAALVGGGVIKTPDIGNEADRFAQQIDPTAYQAQNAIGLVGHLNTMLKGIPGLEAPSPQSA